MTHVSGPPPFLRPTMTDRERALVVAVVGEAEEPWLRALRDARGRPFERLEFLGDSVLDVVMAAHALVAPDCPSCPRPMPGHAATGSTQRFVTDERLARGARASGLGAWLEWDAGPDRRADLVEACVAVAWIAGGWSRAGGVVQRLVHPVGARTLQVLRAGADDGAGAAEGDPPRPSDAAGRVGRRLGAAVLELAAAQLVFTADPGADEGRLSARRAALHRASVVADRARDQHLVDGGGPDPVVSDRVEAVLAGRLLTSGADAALAVARSLFVDRARRS